MSRVVVRAFPFVLDENEVPMSLAETMRDTPRSGVLLAAALCDGSTVPEELKMRIRLARTDAEMRDVLSELDAWAAERG